MEIRVATNRKTRMTGVIKTPLSPKMRRPLSFINRCVAIPLGCLIRVSLRTSLCEHRSYCRCGCTAVNGGKKRKKKSIFRGSLVNCGEASERPRFWFKITERNTRTVCSQQELRCFRRVRFNACSCGSVSRTIVRRHKSEMDHGYDSKPSRFLRRASERLQEELPQKQSSHSSCVHCSARRAKSFCLILINAL